MALNSFVYISEVDNLSDARFAAGMGVELIGFNLDPQNEKALSAFRFREISEWISGVTIVGEFGNANPAKVKALLDEYNVDYLLISEESQLHEFTLLDKPLIFNIRTSESTRDLESTFNFCHGSVDYFLLESEKTTLNEVEQKNIATYASRFPIILGYGIDIHNVSTIVTQLNLKGICLKGSPEIRPGYKDFDEIAAILELLEVEG